MLAPLSNEFSLILSSVADGTRPASAFGTSVTPGNNTYGSYASLGVVSPTYDAYRMLICINSNNTSAQARDTLVTLGFDPSGGTSFTGLGGVSGNEIQDLICSCASGMAGGGSAPSGIWYDFPLFIRAGTTIGAKATVNNATVGTLRVYVVLFCQPRRPELLRVGSCVRTFGSTPASSSGTAITPGTAAESSYVQLGSAVADNELWWWEVGVGINNATMTNNTNAFDLACGDGSNKKQLIQNCLHYTSASETAGKAQSGSFGIASLGDGIYARAQAGPNAADTGISVIAYGVGG